MGIYNILIALGAIYKACNGSILSAFSVCLYIFFSSFFITCVYWIEASVKSIVCTHRLAHMRDKRQKSEILLKQLKNRTYIYTRQIGQWQTIQWPLSNENGMSFFVEFIFLFLFFSFHLLWYYFCWWCARGCWSSCSLQLRNQAETEQHSNNTKQNGYASFMNGKTKRFIWTWVASNHENDFWLLIMSRVFSQQSTVATCRSCCAFFFSHICIDMYICIHTTNVEWQIKYRAASCQMSSNSSLSQCVTPIVLNRCAF